MKKHKMLMARGVTKSPISLLPVKHFTTVLWRLCIVVSIYSCQSYQPASQSAFRYLYDYESAVLHPEFVVYHYSDDSTMVCFRVPTSEILYTRGGADQPFKSSLWIKWYLEKNGTTLPFDSLLVEDSRSSAPSTWLGGEIRLRLSAGESYKILVELTDLKRQTTMSTYLNIEKKNQYSSQNFILRDATSGLVEFDDFVKPGQLIAIESARNESMGVKIFHSPTESKLPPPPFSTNASDLPGIEELSQASANLDSSGVLLFTTSMGRYVLLAGNEKRQGKTLLVSDSYYPDVASINQLIFPLRYVTSKAEYESIVTNSDPKKLIDNFWIECAGSKERARELIRIYYNRVREANYYFSSFTEGWRTDRGMVHLIFGHPNIIRKTEDSETWIYGEEGNISSVSFVFRKGNYGLAENTYLLQRDPMFRSHWERMVTTWRNGRVYNE